MVHMNIEKGKAIDLGNQRSLASVLDNRNTRFSNINAAKDVWWLDIPCEMVESQAEEILHLLLYDHHTGELHHLRVPTLYFRENLSQLVVRSKKDKRMIRIELSADGSTLFRDVRPTGGGVRFGQFLQR
jgi:hypothetical protein